MKINPNESIGFGGYNSQYKGQNPNNSQSFKDSNKKQEFLDIIHETLNEKEQNNDSTNTISADSATTPILTPTNPYGRADGGNYRFDVATQGQSPNVSEIRGSNTATYNESITRLLKEKDERIKNLIARSKEESRRSGSESRESRSVGEGSQGIGRIDNLKAYTTAEERDRLNRLEKAQKFIKAYESALEPNKQHTKDSIKPKQSKQNSNDFGRDL